VYTQEQVDQILAEAKQKWEQEILKPVIQERDELMQYKPQELTDEQKQIKKLQAELLQAKTLATLQQAGLEDFIEFLSVENEKELKVKIEKLSKVLEDRKLNNAYVPQDHKPTDAYSNAEKNNDVVGMIGAKLEKLFQL
jgi:hypothetical protein